MEHIALADLSVAVFDDEILIHSMMTTTRQYANATRVTEELR